MRAEQYIHTLCKKDADSDAVAFGTYSKSDGITAEEANEIHKLIKYQMPIKYWNLSYKEMMELENTGKVDTDIIENGIEKKVTIDEKCPFSFSYFILSSGRYCITLVSPLGGYIEPERDPRKGNMLYHSLVFDDRQLDCYPVELFGEVYLKKNMTIEELNAPRPVPTLPSVEIMQTGKIINRDSVKNFLLGKESQFAYLITMVMQAKERDMSCFLNDSGENLVYWLAAIQMLLPVSKAHLITFNTYSYHYTVYTGVINKKNMCVGIPQGVNSFDYKVQSKNTSMLVYDLKNNIKTEGLPYSPFAVGMAQNYTSDRGMEKIDAFRVFLEETNIDSFNEVLDKAYLFFEFYDSLFEDNKEQIESHLRFVDLHCTESFNEQMALDLMENLVIEESFSEGQMIEIIRYLCKYASYMTGKICEFINDYFKREMESARYENFVCLLDEVSKYPQIYNSYLNYMSEVEHLQDMYRLIEKNSVGRQITTREKKLFVLKFLLQNYEFSNDFENISNNVEKYTYRILQEISDANEARNVIELLESISGKTKEIICRWIEAKPEMKKLLYEFNIVKIDMSVDVQKDYWQIYDKYYKGEKEDISCLCWAYITRKEDVESVCLVIERMQVEQYFNRELVMKMIQCMECISWSELSNVSALNLDVLRKQAVLLGCEQYMQRSMATLWAKTMKDKPVALSELGIKKSAFAAFDVKEQKDFLTEYMGALLDGVEKVDDASCLALFCSVSKPSLFFDSFVEASKRKMDNQVNIMSLLCIACINNLPDENIAQALSPYCRKNLKNMKEPAASKVKQCILERCGERGKAFLENSKTDGNEIWTKFGRLLKRGENK